MKKKNYLKKILSLALGICCMLGAGQSVYAVEEETIQTPAENTAKSGTVITAPLDSRPVSIEYLEDLVQLGGDQFISPNKSNLDFFCEQNNGMDHAGYSQMVRQEIFNNVAANPTEDTTVIINTASYFTGGLVGSRASKNYNDLENGMADLKTLVKTYKAPYYYVNVTMPRTLPEERDNIIWPNQNKLKGLANFYLKYHTANASQITSQFKEVTPAQFLIEWGYVQNKEDELGADKLSAWEREFLDYFNTYYKNNQTYEPYVQAYQNTYEQASKLIKDLFAMTMNGEINEVVISIDDFQLPNFIQYCSKLTNDDTSWIQKNSGHVIKYSFSRTMLQIGAYSVYGYQRQTMGEDSLQASVKGLSSTINYLHGVDEMPQLIYARDLVRRKKLSTKFANFQLCHSPNSQNLMSYVGFYDSATTQELLNNTKNFVTKASDPQIRQTDRDFKMYINQHLQGVQNMNDAAIEQNIREMFSAYDAGSNIGLIEIYSFDVINSGDNQLFKKLSSKAYLESQGIQGHSIAQLGAYCSWNTGANAVGIGMAQAQVYGIAEQLTKNASQTAISAAKVLSQHLLEDGVYSVQLKSTFNGSAYGLSNAASIQDNQILKNKLNSSGVLQNFVYTPLRIGAETVTLQNAWITRSGFPWLRRFECYVETDFSL